MNWSSWLSPSMLSRRSGSHGSVPFFLLLPVTLLWMPDILFGGRLLTTLATHGQKVHQEGQIMLGGLFPVHQKGIKTKCGGINKDRGIQRLEAMLYAIDRINADPNLLGNLTLGATIMDTCSSDSYALNQSLEFIRASINTVDASSFECSDRSTPKLKFSNKAITGVIGGSYSEVSLQVANLLRLFRIPQVSPASTGTTLSDKSRYDFFARTVPPDTFQAVALVDLVQVFNWSYISVVSSEGQYGDSGLTAFVREARARNICIAANEKVTHSADEKTYEQIYHNIQQKTNARGVVLFARAEDARGILLAAKRVKSQGWNYEDVVWVASDGWGKQDNIVEGIEDVAEGAITVELLSNHVKPFDDYMQSLDPAKNTRNPWFKEYWENMFSCKLPENLSPEEKDNVTITCSPHIQLDKSVGYKQESKVQFVIDAVYAMAHGLHDAWVEVCGSSPPDNYCDALRDMDGGHFYKNYLLNVSFVDLAGSKVKFDKQGDGLGRYNIYNYRRVASNNSVFAYQEIGQWNDTGLDLHVPMEDIVFSGGRKTVPPSVCSMPCGVGQIKNVQAGDTCCWICSDCKDWEKVKDEFTCEDCGIGRWPYEDKLECFDLVQQHMRWDSIFAIVPMAIACFGIILTLGVISVFIKNNDTPIVKASGRELSYMLLAGILLCYLMSFALLSKPTPVSCGIQRFGVGFAFAIIYSSLLTKTNRISRIFDSARKSARRPSFISPKSQVVITLIFMSVQVIATVVWFVVEPPGTRQYTPKDKRNEVILKCSIKDSSFLVSLVYNMILITICTVYAVKTRKIPENFNESKFIGFTMYTTCIIWLAFVPIYFGTGNSFEVQITTLCISISLSAYVALFCLFSPKIYIILFHPDKNVRKLTMNSATYKKAPTSSTCGTSANHGNWINNAARPDNTTEIVTTNGSSVEQVKLTVQTTPSKGQTESDRDSLASL